MIRRRLVSMLSAIALVLTLFTMLPEGALKAQAGSIAGKGTKDDPYIIINYYDLQQYTTYCEDEQYIKLGNDIIIDDQSFYIFDIHNNATIHLDLAGHTLRRTDKTGYNRLFDIYEYGTLIIDDSVGGGVVRSGFAGGEKITPQNLFYLSDNGTLIINQGTFYNFCSVSQEDEIIYMMGGNLTINNGDFYGRYKTLNVNKGNAVINGGRFYNSKHIRQTNGKATNIHQFILRTDTNTNIKINGAELISSDGDAFSNPAGMTVTTANSENESIRMDRFISENTQVYIDGGKLNTATAFAIRGNRILIYTPKNITGTYWDGYKLNWDPYPGTVYYYLLLEKKNGSAYITIKDYLYTNAASMDFEGLIKANGAGIYRVVFAAFTNSDEQISNLMSKETYFDPRETVSEISLAVTEPRDGVTITKATPSSTGEKRYTVTKSLWFKGTSTSGAAMESTEKFVEGQTYTLYCEVRTTSGYKFVSPSATVNGKTAATVNHTGDGIVSLKYTVTAPLNIKTVNVTVTEPVAGAKPTVGDVTLTGTGVVIAPVNVKQNGTSVKVENTVVWSLGEEVLDVGTSKFEAGKTYTAAVYLKAADGYEIVSDDLKVYINGKQAELDPASLLSLILYGTVIYKAEFECEASGQQLLGDVNKDGKVTADDAIIIARLAAGYGDYSTRYDSNVADMNRDGKATADDAIIAARVAAGYGDYVTRYTRYI